MEDIKKVLENPFETLEGNTEKFQNECSIIAEKLFSKYCIKCGNEKVFYFAEIEFYYYDQTWFNKELNEVTYPRICEAGDIFYHLSGIDICFKSNLPNDFKKKKIGTGGGILIRSIWEKDDKGSKIITVGPLTCMDKILNACKGKQMPKLEKLPISEQIDLKPVATYRYLGKNDFDNISKGTNKDGKLKLAFYDKRNKDLWDHARSSYYDNRLYLKEINKK